MLRNCLQVILCVLFMIFFAGKNVFCKFEDFERNADAETVFRQDTISRAMLIDKSHAYDADTTSLDSERFVISFDILPENITDDSSFLEVDLVSVLEFREGTLCFVHKLIENFYTEWHSVTVVAEDCKISLFVDNEFIAEHVFDDSFFGIWVNFSADGDNRVYIDNVKVENPRECYISDTGFKRYGIGVSKPLEGENSVAVSVMNFAEENKVLLLIVAKYDLQGILTDIEAVKKISADVNELITVYSYFDVEDVHTKIYKYFVWDSEMKPY